MRSALTETRPAAARRLFLISEDEAFAETLREKFAQWGWRLAHGAGHDPAELTAAAGSAVVLVDIRRRDEQAAEMIKEIRRQMAQPEIILLNRADNIPAAIAGMQAGATDEINEPFDAAALRNALAAADQRRRARLQKEKSGGIWAAFSKAMAAAAFAQAGEFETAIEFARRPQEEQAADHEKDQERDDHE